MATEVGENVQVKANLAFMAKVIAIVGGFTCQERRCVTLELYEGLRSI